MKLWSAVSTAVFSIALVAAMLPTAASAVATVPPAPANVAGTHPSSGIINITWDAPASDGGAVITKYTATASPGGSTCETTSTAPATPSTTCNIPVTNGVSYTVTVTATNSAGTGAASAPSAAIPTTAITPVPGLLTDAPLVFPGNTEIRVTWTTPAATGSAPTSYTAIAQPGGASVTVPSTSTTATITGLTNGVSYTVGVYGTSASGDGLPKAATATTPFTAPDAPTGVAILNVAGTATGTIIVGWTVPANDGGKSIINYTATLSPGPGTCSTTPGDATANTCTITGLANDTAVYTVTVTATNNLQSAASVPSASGNAGTPATTPSTGSTAPGVPQSVTFADVPGTSGELLATWGPPASDGGSAVTGYTVTYGPLTEIVALRGTVACTTTSAFSCTLTGLDQMKRYTVTVKATNSINTGAPSAQSGWAIPTGVPGLVKTLAADSVTLTTANITWAASDNTGGRAGSAGAVTYVVTSTNGTVAYTTGTSATISSLTGPAIVTVHEVAATAINGAPGSGADSTVSFTPSVIPSAPQNFKVVPGGTNGVTLTWDPPQVIGVGALTYYVTGTAATPATAVGTGITYTDTVLLLDGNVYSYTVTVKSGTVPGGTAGTATASGKAGLLLGGPPNRVSGVDTTPLTTLTSGTSPGTLDVGWDAVAGATGYVATALTSAGVPTAFSCSTTLLGCTISGLTVGTIYKVQVATTNLIGTGPAVQATHWFGYSSGPPVVPGAALATSAIPHGLSAEPTLVKATPGNGTVNLTWLDPANTTANPFVDIVVTQTPSPTSTAVTAATQAQLMSGLTNGTEYTFVVKARNSLGTTTGVEVKATPAAAPGKPTAVSATAGDASASASWTAPAVTGGAAITNYRITATPTNTAYSPIWVKTGSTTTSGTINGLLNGVQYNIHVAAINSGGTGADSTVTSADRITAAAVPDAPTGAAAAVSGSSVAVNWVASVFGGGLPITTYTVTASPGSASCQTTGVLGAGCTVSGLDWITAYSFDVVATNTAGNSAAATVTATTARANPALSTTVNHSFGDVSGLAAGSQTAIAAIQNLGITLGTHGGTTYSPADPVTRQDMALFISRSITAVGHALNSTVTHSFSDVGGLSADRQNAIAALYNTTPKITTGTSTTTYSPADSVTREQMATFLGRTWESLGGTCDNTVTHSFGDLNGNFADPWVSCIFNLGITRGTNGGATFSPNAQVTREQMALFLYRFVDKAVATGL